MSKVKHTNDWSSDYSEGTAASLAAGGETGRTLVVVVTVVLTLPRPPEMTMRSVAAARAVAARVETRGGEEEGEAGGVG